MTLNFAVAPCCLLCSSFEEGRARRKPQSPKRQGRLFLRMGKEALGSPLSISFSFSLFPIFLSGVGVRASGFLFWVWGFSISLLSSTHTPYSMLYPQYEPAFSLKRRSISLYLLEQLLTVERSLSVAFSPSSYHHCRRSATCVPHIALV